MVRGSGLDGLCGMSRRRDEGIYELIRPLLAQPREEIEAFLKECGQSYCTDETNLDTEYSRNRIRHQVLPELKQINGQAVAHINQSAALLQEMRDFLNEEAEHIREMYVVEKAMAYSFIRACGRSATKLCSGRFSIRRSERWQDRKRYHKKTYREREKPLFSQVGRYVELPYQVLAERNYHGILLRKETEKRGRITPF